MNFNKNYGFTLIEVMVSIVILMVGMLGLLQGVNLAYKENLKTILRNNATELADAQMSAVKQKKFELISTNAQPHNGVTKADVKSAFKSYSVITQGTLLTPRTKEVDITISWRHAGQRYEHIISSMVSSNE